MRSMFKTIGYTLFACGAVLTLMMMLTPARFITWGIGFMPFIALGLAYISFVLELKFWDFGKGNKKCEG